jgi:hypothetical protein
MDLQRGYEDSELIERQGQTGSFVQRADAFQRQGVGPAHAHEPGSDVALCGAPIGWPTGQPWRRTNASCRDCVRLAQGHDAD